MSQTKENIAFQSTRPGGNPVYNLGRTPPSDDFFTDSLLDTSKIPTPSPTRPIVGQEPPYKPRRAIGNTRALKAAWNGSAKPARTSSSASDRARPRSQQLKPAPIQRTRRSPTPTRREDLTSTPSPPRRSVTDLQSPTSESSPPKGLTDVYQRIADEEDLAAQEGEIEDEDDYTEDSMAIGGVHLNGDRALLDRIRQSRSPSSLPGSRRHSPEASTGDANKENHRHDAGSVLSDPTGMSFLRDLTDQALAAKLTPHTIDRAKDRARLDRALQKDSPIAFSRAYSRQNGRAKAQPPKKDSPVAFSRAYANPKGGLTSEDVLNLYCKVDEEDHTERSSTSSALTERSEPPPNVPRTWGSKGKIGKEWLHKLHDRNGNPSNNAQKPQVPESSQIDWTAAAAEVPLPSIESSSTPKNISPDPPRQATLHKQPSFDRTKEWDFNDFTGQSLQVSNTPPVRVRTNGLDQLRDKEIESLEKRAVTTNRLEEIKKKDSRELLRKVSRSPSVGTAKRDLFEADLSRPKSHEVKFEDAGEPIPDTPIVIYKGTASDNKDEEERETGVRQPALNREDSLNKLQRLARAMSDSPRPSSSPEDWSLIREAEESGEIPAASNGEAPKPTLHTDLSRKSSKQVADVEATPQGVKAANSAKTPVISGAWTDTILPDTVKTVNRQRDSSKYTQTPHVNAGGWIDTPMPHGKRQVSSLAPIPIEEIPEGLTDGLNGKSSRPPSASANGSNGPTQKKADIPRSALTGLLDKAKQKLTTQDGATFRESNDTLNLGDATIESLEDLLTLDNADMTTLIRMGAEFEAREQILRGAPRDDASAEAALLDRLGSKLDRLRTNIHDARKGISKLEHQVSHADTPEDQQALEMASSCKSCRGPRAGFESTPISTPTRVYLAVPLPRFFHDKQKDHWLPRPTLLGWTTLAFSVWYLSESAMCDRYCHPLYAEYYEWPEEAEPRFGYALPTMLWRWSRIREFGPLLLGPLWTLLVAFVRIIGQAFGLMDGFVDDLPSKSKDLPRPVTFGERITNPRLGPDLSMMNDEFI
jgi:hypothetical protein